MNDRQSTPDILGAALAVPQPKTERISVSLIKINDGTQMRAGLNTATVAEYAEAMKASNSWGEFPPLVLYHDGETYWLADGFHRLAAYKMIFPAVIDMRDWRAPAIVKAGNRRDAILHAAGANANHGLRRTNDDKRRAVEVLLRDAEWAQWSDGAIARQCQVSDRFVATVRKELTPNRSESPTRIGADGRTYNTANIGANRPVTPKPTVAASPDFASPAVLKGIVARVWDTLNPMRDAALTMRMAAEARIGANDKSGQFWDQCKAAMGDDIRAYRHADLQSAIYSVVLDREMATWGKREEQPVTTTQPAPRDRTHVLSDIRTWLYAHAGTPKEIVELGEALHYREFGHPQWDDMFPDGAENDDVYWALEQCIDEAAAKVPEYADGLPAPAPAPVFTPAMDAGTLVVALPDTRPYPEVFAELRDKFGHHFNDNADAPADEDRRAQLRAWWVRLISLRSDLGDWADLTGRHTETLVLGRELTKLLDITQGEIDALEKGVILA